MLKIITDSTSDLTKEILEKNNIDVIPLYIHLGTFLKAFLILLSFSKHGSVSGLNDVVS